MKPGYNTWDRRLPGAALLGGDPEIAALIAEETRRQSEGLELIASENFVSPAVLEAMGSSLTNKYAEGLPGKRYYGGCEVVDKVEQIAIDRAKQLFGADHANVQPHSGATANAAVYLAFLKPGDTVMGLDLSQGGHLTHGSPVNFSGLNYRAVHSGVTDEGLIDYAAMREVARTERPKLIIAGYSAYSRVLDYQQFADAAREVGAIFMVDMAHFAGLAATGVYPSPIPFADVVTTTTHKTLRGPRGGLILCKAQHAKAIDKAMFPGTQGGPLEHVIAAKAVAFKEALEPAFKAYQAQVLANARKMAETLTQRGLRIVSGRSESHLFLVDLRAKKVTGKDAETALGKANITVNKNSIPNDPEKPFVTSGIRVGSPAMTTRGLGEVEAAEVANLVADALEAHADDAGLAAVRAKVNALCARFPVYGPAMRATYGLA